MYFSKISFDATNHWQRMVKVLNQKLYQEHRMIWSFFPGDKEAKRDFLYRREDKANVPFFYLLSGRKPVSDDPLFIIQTQSFLPKLEEGDHLQFSLRANAVKSYKVDESKRRVRKDIVQVKKESYQQDELPPLEHIRYEAGWEWLEQQGEKGGFTVNSLAVENHQVHQFSKEKNAKQRTFASLDFSGVLQVSDVLVFEKVLFNGLGRSKAFGCGLFLVRRI
ncbi:MAG: type I-E CRISPR-associated protein Cas6/Cse3/CasE [Thiolinea sp.]